MQNLSSIKPYARFAFNVFMVMYLAFFAVHSFLSFITGIVNVDSVDSNGFLMAYLFLVFASIVAYFVMSIKNKKMDLLPLTFILVLINVFY